MKCQCCKKDFPENEIEESHDVPVYLFEGDTRNIRKNQADKFGRHNLCKQCHKSYEGFVAAIMIKPLPRVIKDSMIKSASKFAEGYFKNANS